MKKWIEEMRERFALEGGIFDHAIWGKEIVVLQPYPVSKDKFKKLIMFCDEWNLDFLVHSRSIHSKDCFTIQIEEKAEWPNRQSWDSGVDFEKLNQE